jgi:putative FmdB family regulatory protein
MPIYEYVCIACGRRIDVVHSISGTGPATCEVCGGAMKKALSAPAIHFKGSGWAKKDARSAATAAAKPAATDAPKEGAAASTGAASTDGEGPAAKPGPASTPATTATPPASTSAGGSAS